MVAKGLVGVRQTDRPEMKNIMIPLFVCQIDGTTTIETKDGLDGQRGSRDRLTHLDTRLAQLHICHC